MEEPYVINQDVFEKAIPILESRSFMEQKESRQILLSGLCQLEHFKSLMRDPLLEHHLYPYLEDFAQQVSYKYIPRGRIIYHDNDNIGSLFFILRGSFTEFKLKSEDDLKKELFWDSQAEQLREELLGVTKKQKNLQDKRTQELLQLEQEKETIHGNDMINDIHNEPDLTKLTPQQRQIHFIRQKIQEQQMDERKTGKSGKQSTGAQTFQFKTQPTLEEVFFTEEFKTQSRKLKEASDMALANEKFYSGSAEEELLRMDNKHQERYFREHRCLYKKTRDIHSGQSFGELYGNVDNTVVCKQSAFLLSISSKIFLQIFEALTERLNYAFHVLANSFPSTKKVILHDFAFQFTEQHLEFNQTLFQEGDSPTYVYIMKSGEIDYRKKLLVLGQPQMKRLSMINQGDIFGQEDIFSTGRQYSVHSCVNNSVVYRIKKEALFLFQFMSSLKNSVKSKAESLAKKLIELQARNSLPPEEQLVHAVQNLQTSKSSIFGSSIMNQAEKANGSLYHQKSSIMSKNNNIHQQSQISNVSMINSSIAGRNQSQQQLNLSNTKQSSSAVQSKNQSNSFKKIPSMLHIPSSTSSYFFQTKNVNFGESDSDLTFQNASLALQLKSAVSASREEQYNDKNGSSKIGNNLNKNASNTSSNNNQQIQKQPGKIANVGIFLPSRAQPESVYSRIVRPDSAFKEEIEQMKKEQAEQLLQFNSSKAHMTNQHNNSSLVFNSHSIMNNRGSLSSTTNNIKISDFKLNRMPKNKYALSLSVSSDTKQLSKKDNSKQSDQSIEVNQQINPINSSVNSKQNQGSNNKNNQSVGTSNEIVKQVKQSESEDKNANIQQGQFTRNTLSLNKYKNQAKEYFDKDSKLKSYDFFAEFQNHKQDAQVKLLSERSQKNIGSQQNLETVTVVAGQRSNSSQKDMRQNSSSLLDSKLIQTNTKNIRINADSQDPTKQISNKSTRILNSQLSYKIRSSEGLTSTEPDEERGEIQSPNGKFLESPLKSANNLNEMNQNKKIRFANNSNQIQPQMKEIPRMKSFFKAGNDNMNGIQSSPTLSSREIVYDQSVPFRIRDHQDDLGADKLNNNPQSLNQRRTLINSKIEAEQNVLKNIESSLSFGNLRAATGFKLGHSQIGISGNQHAWRDQFKK